MRTAVALAVVVSCEADTVKLTEPEPTSPAETTTPYTEPPVEFSVEVTDRSVEAGVTSLEYDGTYQHGRICVVADLDGDGLEDLVVGNPADLSYWYRNVSTPGSLAFQPMDVLDPGGWMWGTSAADYDADGDLDLAVARGGFEMIQANRVLRNDGDDGAGSVLFSDMGPPLGLIGMFPTPFGSRPNGSVAAKWLDFDGDGDLDLWFDETIEPNDLEDDAWVQMSLIGRNSMFRQDAPDVFVDVTDELGFVHNARTQFSSWFDFDNDHDLDMFEPVMNLIGPSPNRFFVNDGGVFVEQAQTIMLDGTDLSYPRRSFSSTVGDFNQDGWLDLFVFVNGQETIGPFLDGHLLLLNVEGRGFVEAALPAGLNDPFDPGFRDHEVRGVMGSSTEDVNLDGIPDIYMGMGGPSGGWTDHLYLSTGLGTHDFGGDVGVLPIPLFEDATSLIDFPAPEVVGGPVLPPYPYRTHAMCITDFDQDGTREIFVANGGTVNWGESGEPDRLFSFDFDPAPGFVALHLVGDGVNVNPQAIDARIAVVVEEDGVERTAYDTVRSHNGFGAQHGYWRTVGLGRADRVLRVIVTWPNGETTAIDDVSLGDRLEVVYTPPS